MLYIWKHQIAKEPHPHLSPQMKKTRPIWMHVLSHHWLEMNPISNCINHHAYTRLMAGA